MRTYTRKELSQKYNIPRSQWDQKHDDLLDHLQDFMDIKEIKSERGRYTYEIEGEMPESIPKLRAKLFLLSVEKDMVTTLSAL